MTSNDVCDKGVGLFCISNSCQCVSGKVWKFVPSGTSKAGGYQCVDSAGNICQSTTRHLKCVITDIISNNQYSIYHLTVL